MERTILVAEDFDDTRLLIKVILESYEYGVIEALDGVNAVEMFKRHSPDLVLMDMAMPGMDGLSATRTIRSLENGAGVPIIAITAHGAHFYEKAIAAGCSELIEKPVDFDSLLSAISRYFDI